MTRTFAELTRLECYAYARWRRSGYSSGFWYRLAVACNRAVKSHMEYRGARA